MRAFLAIAKALADENRARALMALGGGELCLCQIIEVLGMSPSTVSKHMSILHQAGLVERRKDGRWEGETVITTDAKALCCVREQDREALTACYSEK